MSASSVRVFASILAAPMQGVTRAIRRCLLLYASYPLLLLKITLTFLAEITESIEDDSRWSFNKVIDKCKSNCIMYSKHHKKMTIHCIRIIVDSHFCFLSISLESSELNIPINAPTPIATAPIPSSSNSILCWCHSTLICDILTGECTVH